MKNIKKFAKNLKKLKIEFLKNESLKEHCTYKIGGKAKLFVLIKSVLELKSFLALANSCRQNFFVLGFGSKVLIDDGGLSVVVKLCRDFEKFEISGLRAKVFAGAGLIKLASATFKKSLSGLEFASSIPASVGGATFMNAGAFGQSFGDLITSVVVMDFDGNIKRFSHKNCDFGYRKSIFQCKNLIILQVYLKFKKDCLENIKKRVLQNQEFRKKNQPKALTCGSIFKKGENFSAGELIDKLGLKGAKCGYAKISTAHANFFENTKKAKSYQVKRLIDFCKERVYFVYGVSLEEEVIYFKEKK